MCQFKYFILLTQILKRRKKNLDLNDFRANSPLKQQIKSPDCHVKFVQIHR